MKIKNIGIKNIIILLLAVVLGSTLALRWRKNRNNKKSGLFETNKPKKRTLTRTVDITGALEITDNLKISSLVAGTIQKILIEENDKVKKGDILAIIDNGKGNTDVRAWQAGKDQAQANFEYSKSHFERIKILYKDGHISHDTFEQESATFEGYKGKLNSAAATLEKYAIEWENTRVRAPSNGTIVAVHVSEGTGVTTALNATVLFELAKDLCKMTAVMDIDEGDIADIKEGQKIELKFDSYRDKLFHSIIKRISFAPHTKSGSVAFDAEAEVDNSKKLLRPGMTVDGMVVVSKAANVPSITSQALYISKESLQLVDEKLEYKVEPLAKKASTDKTVWILSGKTFTQKIIKTGVTDEMYYQILSGVEENDDVVIDVVEKNRLEELYKKHFKRF